MVRISHKGIPSTTLREVSLIRKLGNCENIVKLIEVLKEKKERKKETFLFFSH